MTIEEGWTREALEDAIVSRHFQRHGKAITNDVIRWHLSGQDDFGKDFVVGIYPMLLNETCFFLAADFDKSSWEEDACAFLKTCHQLNLPAALERSRSGKGAHGCISKSRVL